MRPTCDPNVKSCMAKSDSMVRIIGGRWRGKRLPVLDQPSLRPTGNRVKETLFNWLQPEMVDAVVVDLFAGSGALGFESLSRGARSVVLNEFNGASAKQLQSILASLDTDQGDVWSLDWQQALSKLEHPVHILFLDPPFELQPISEMLEQVENSKKLADDAAIYIEQPKKAHFELPSNWQVRRHKTAGDVQYLLCDRT